MFPSFFFADFKGAYSYIQTEWMPHFWEIVHSGGINPDIDNWGDIKRCRKIPIQSILLWVQITRMESDLVRPNEVLMILSDKSTLGDSIKELDMICLPESAFFYLLNEGQSTSLYHVDSIIVGDTNQYQISKYKKIYWL